MQDAKISDFTGQGETILAIESDPLMRELISEILAMNGYRVYVVRDIREARQYYRQQPEQFQLILVDLWLAGLSDMLAQILHNQPDMSIVLTSHQPVENRYYRHIGLSILEKPFDVAELFFALRMALDGEKNPRNRSYLN